MVKDAQIDLGCEGNFKFTTGYGATKVENAIANYAAFLAPVIMCFVSWQSTGWSVALLIVILSALIGPLTYRQEQLFK